MKFAHIIMFCCFSAVCLKASEVLEVSGHVGGEVSIHCSGHWPTDNSSEHNNMYFCKNVCSRENILIQTERKRPTIARRGRYRLEANRGHSVFNVTIKRLKRADAGRYCCGVEKSFNTLYQDVSLKVLNASTVPPGPPPSTTTLQTKEEALPQSSFLSSSEPSSVALTLPTTETTNRHETTNLTDTTVVIIVSVSLALLVCAVIPLIFYGHWRANAEGQNLREENKGETHYCEENKVVASTQTEVRLQSLEPDADPESSDQDVNQYAAIYQALDPIALD